MRRAKLYQAFLFRSVGETERTKMLSLVVLVLSVRNRGLSIRRIGGVFTRDTE